MTVDDMLRVARETIADLPWCFVVTAAEDGAMNARLVQAGRPAEDWTIRFMTDRRCRKIAEVRRNPRMTLAFLNEAARAYVTLIGHAALIEDVAVKRAIWRPEMNVWHPSGPEDPDNQLVAFTADRIELYSGSADIRPPPRGFCAATLSRVASGWDYAPSSAW